MFCQIVFFTLLLVSVLEFICPLGFLIQYYVNEYQQYNFKQVVNYQQPAAMSYDKNRTLIYKQTKRKIPEILQLN